MKDTRIQARISKKMKKEIDEIAQKLNTTTSKLIVECLQKIIEKNYKLLEKN